MNRDARGRFTDGNRPRDPKTGRFVKGSEQKWYRFNASDGPWVKFDSNNPPSDVAVFTVSSADMCQHGTFNTAAELFYCEYCKTPVPLLQKDGTGWQRRWVPDYAHNCEKTEYVCPKCAEELDQPNIDGMMATGMRNNLGCIPPGSVVPDGGRYIRSVYELGAEDTTKAREALCYNEHADTEPALFDLLVAYI